MDARTKTLKPYYSEEKVCLNMLHQHHYLDESAWMEGCPFGDWLPSGQGAEV
ncbi:MAG: hypothetical protein ACLRMZ_03150 [Blautia marasmi]